MAETRIRIDKQIQKAPAAKQVPLSDGSGELQYAGIDALIKAGETLTHLNSVEVTGGNLIIKYTAEDGNQQVVSTRLNYAETDINVTDAKLDNPSAGVYRLIITETDGTTYPVDLPALLAVVTQNTQYLTISGNGTPQNPLKVDVAAAFWDRMPKVLDNLDDCTVTQPMIDAEAAKQGNVALVWNTATGQWVPKSISSLENFREVTETFRDLTGGNSVALQTDISRIIPQSIKVFRNGMRQDYGMDYIWEEGGDPKRIFFFEPFTDRYAEKVTVDYRPAA